MSDNKSKFLKGVSATSLTTLSILILEIFTFSCMSRLLSKPDFGYFAVLQGFMSVCMCIADAGLGSSIIQKKDVSEKHVSTAFTLSVIIGFLMSLIICLFAPVIAVLIADETMTMPLRIMAWSIFLYCLMSIGQSLLVKSLRFKSYGVTKLVAFVLSQSLAIYMAWKGAGIYAIMTSTLGNSIVQIVILYTTSVKIPKLCIVKSEIKGILSFGGWLTLSTIVNTITQKLDSLVLAKWLSVEALGAYNRPAGFVNKLSMQINGVFDTVLFPMLSNIQDDLDKVQSTLLRSIRLLNSFSVVLCCVFFFNADLIITVFFGSEWLELVPILRIISLTLLLKVDSRLVDCFFRSLALVKTGFYLRLFAAVLTLSSLYIGAQHGIIGVAVSLVSSNILINLIKIIVLGFKVKVHITSILYAMMIALRPGIAISCVGIPLLFTNSNIIVQLLEALIMGVLIIVMFLFVPSMVGKEYADSLYPSIKKIRNKILRISHE